MKESMAVAKTLALSLLDKSQMKKLVKEFEETKLQGIHIHVPEGATPKDGPSAGAAITLVIYSFLTLVLCIVCNIILCPKTTERVLVLSKNDEKQV